MTDIKQVIRLLGRLHAMIGDLSQNHNIDVHRRVNQFFYMQKSAELELIVTEMNELFEKQKRLQHLLDVLYPEAFIHWQRDARWINLNANSEKDTVQDLSM